MILCAEREINQVWSGREGGKGEGREGGRKGGKGGREGKGKSDLSKAESAA